MPELKPMRWFRLYSDILHDEKIEEISFQDRWHYVALLCMKCCGLLDKDYNTPGARDRKIYRELGLEKETAEFTRDRLVEVGLVDEGWQPVAWDRRQRRSDRDETNRERQQRYRERVSNALVTVLDTDTDTETEEEDIPKQPAVLPPNRRRGTVDGTPYKEIVSTYHDVLPELPRVAKLTETRKTHIRARHGKDFPTLEDWREYFGYVRESKFLMGFSGGERKFKAGFDFLIRESSAVNICEGKYHD